MGPPAGFFSSVAAPAAATSLPGLGDGFRPRVADTERVLLPADRGSESPAAGDSRPLAPAPDIAPEPPDSSKSQTTRRPLRTSEPQSELKSARHCWGNTELGPRQAADCRQLPCSKQSSALYPRNPPGKPYQSPPDQPGIAEAQLRALDPNPRKRVSQNLPSRSTPKCQATEPHKNHLKQLRRGSIRGPPSGGTPRASTGSNGVSTRRAGRGEGKP